MLRAFKNEVVHKWPYHCRLLLLQHTIWENICVTLPQENTPRKSFDYPVYGKHCMWDCMNVLNGAHAVKEMV